MDRFLYLRNAVQSGAGGSSHGFIDPYAFQGYKGCQWQLWLGLWMTLALGYRPHVDSPTRPWLLGLLRSVAQSKLPQGTVLLPGYVLLPLCVCVCVCVV